MPGETRLAWTDSPSAHAIWVASGESPEWIADRTDALLRRLGKIFGIAAWRLATGEPWQGSSQALADLVRRNPVRDMVSAEIGETVPGEGYSLAITGDGSRVSLLIRIAAGNSVAGKRLPRRRLNIELRETQPQAFTSTDATAVCDAVAQAWQPSTVALSDNRVRQVARRGGWKVPVGYRIWISSELGAIRHTPDGLVATATTPVVGTMVSAPDDWPAERIVAATTELLTANGIDEVPR